MFFLSTKQRNRPSRAGGRSRIAVILALAIFVLGIVPWSTGLSVWAQSPGKGDMVVPPPDPANPLTPNLQQNGGLKLTDLLWGISRLQSSRLPLSQVQVQKVRPVVKKVLEGSAAVDNFDGKVKRLLSVDQLSYIELLAASGKLNERIDGLPKASPGQDPLVLYLIDILEKKAASGS